MFSSAMKINEKNVASFAASDSTVDKEGYLSKKNDVKGFQRRWFVLKGNLLLYYDKKQDKEPSGLIVLESYSVQASATEKHGFEISFDGPGTRTYVLVSDNDEEMQSWMRSVSHASYEFLRGIVNELQKQVNGLTTSHSHVTTDRSPTKGEGGKVPIVPRPKQKVENGVLVDVTEVPPIPPKKKLVVIKTPSPEPSSDPAHTIPYRPIAPYTNPVVVPSSSKGPEPLSPSSTMDRTPILTPTSAGSDASPPPIPAKVDKPHPQTLNHAPPFTHTPAIVSLGLERSPLKDTYQVHKELMDAVKMAADT